MITKVTDKVLNINKFNFLQAFNDSKGKTSLSAICGFFITVIGAGGFVSSGLTVLIMVIFKFEKDQNVLNFLNSLTMQSATVIAMGVALVGANRLSKDKEISKETIDETKKEDDSTSEKI